MTVEWPGMSVLSSNHITPLNEQTKNISKPTTVNLFTQSQSAGASHNNVKSAGQSVERSHKYLLILSSYEFCFYF